MKPIITFLLCLFAFHVMAQTEPIYLETNEEEESLQFVVYNNTEYPVEVEFILHDVKGLRGSKRKSTASIPANGSEIIKKLKITGEYHFRYELNKSYSSKTLAVKERGVDDVDLDAGIIVFNKKKCSRCEYLVTYLMENDIDFQLMDLNNKRSKRLMYQLLEESGVYEKRVMTPIVVVDKDITYSHQDLEGFAEALRDR